MGQREGDQKESQANFLVTSFNLATAGWLIFVITPKTPVSFRRGLLMKSEGKDHKPVRH